MYSVYAVVVTYNGERWINKCLGSLEQSACPLGVVVIDNCSFDRTRDVIKESFPGITLVESPVNHGFARANNIGIARALNDGADYIFLINQDAWIEPDTVSRLIDVQRETTCSLISPLHFGRSGDRLDALFESYLSRDLSAEEILAGMRKRETFTTVSFVNAAAWLVSRGCFETVGGFGYLFPHYGEDRDFVQRMKYHGHRLAVATDARIFHDRDGRPLDRTFAKQRAYYRRNSLVRAVDVNFSFGQALWRAFAWSFKDILFRAFSEKMPFLFAIFFVNIFSLFRLMAEVTRYRRRVAAPGRLLFLDNGSNPGQNKGAQ